MIWLQVCLVFWTDTFKKACSIKIWMGDFREIWGGLYNSYNMPIHTFDQQYHFYEKEKIISYDIILLWYRFWLSKELLLVMKNDF